MPTLQSFDAIIIGAGAAGDPLARALAQSGKKTLLVERESWGGTCTNHGCTPTKALEASARIAHFARHASEWGIECGLVSVDMPAVRKRVAKIQDEFRRDTKKGFDETPDLHLVLAEARFDGPERVVLRGAGGEETHATAPLIVINTGTRPVTPPLDGLDSVSYLTSDTLLEIDYVPEHLIILGGNYIGLEMAQTFRRFGSRVTVVETNDHILPREDEDIAQCLTQSLRKEGLTFYLDTEAQSVAPHDEGVQVTLKNGTVLTGTHLLVATGRTPNTDTLNVESLGMALDDKGFVQCGDDLATSVPGVWAAGDVSGSPQFNHIAYDDYSILRSQLLGDKARTRKGRLAPYVVYTEPLLGRVGLSRQEAEESGKSFHIVQAPMTESAYATERGETDGMIKILVEKETGLLLGAAILGLHGDEAVSLIHLAMVMGTTYTELCNIPFAHPTLADTIGGLMRQVDSCEIVGTGAGEESRNN